MTISLTARVFPAIGCLAAFYACLAAPQQPPPEVAVSPLAQVRNGRDAKDNNQILTTGIRGPRLSSNHALIITVSQYPRSPLPGVLTDRKLGIELAQRFGVPPKNIVELSEQQVTLEGLTQALRNMNEVMLPGDRLFIYYSGHGARSFNKETKQCDESIVMQNMRFVSKNEFSALIRPLSAKADKTIVMLDSCHSGGVAQTATSRGIGDMRAKFVSDGSSAQCAAAVNEGGTFSQSRGVDLSTTDHNLVVVAAARKNEIAWDTSRGGALTYNFEQCLEGGTADADRSGSISMQELTDCLPA
jgi:metacaspase-1